MANNPWGSGTGAGTDGLASTAANWFNDTLPAAGDTIVFDGSVTINCRLDIALSAQDFDMQNAYTGAIDGATDNLNHTFTGDLTLDGTNISMGSGTWEYGGNLDYSGITTFANNSGKFKATGVAKTITPKTSASLFNIEIATGASITQQTNNLVYNGVCTVDGTITVNTSISLKSQLSTADLKVSATGTIDGAGTYEVGNACSVSVQLGLVDTAFIKTIGNHVAGASTEIVPGDYGTGEITFLNNAPPAGTLTFNSGTYTFGDMIVDVTFSSGTTAMDNSVNNPNIKAKSITLTETGASATINYTRGTGTITLEGSGSGTQTSDFLDNTVEALTVNDSGATKSWLSSFTTKTFINTAGTVLANATTMSVEDNWTNNGTFTAGTGTVDLTTATACVISGATSFNRLTSTVAGKSITGTTGQTHTITGPFILQGDEGNNIALTTFDCDIQDTQGLARLTVLTCDASAGTSAKAANSTDSGGSTDWLFGESFSTDFDGTNDYVTVATGNQSVLVAFGTGEFSVSGRFKLDATATAFQSVAAYGTTDNSTLDRWSVGVMASDDGTNPSELQFLIGDSATNSEIFSDAAIDIAAWYFFVCAKDASGDMRMYLSKELAEVALQADTTNSTHDLSDPVNGVFTKGALPLNSHAAGHYDGHITNLGVFGEEINLTEAKKLHRCELSKGVTNIAGVCNPISSWRMGNGPDTFNELYAINDITSIEFDGVEEYGRITHNDNLRGGTGFTLLWDGIQDTTVNAMLITKGDVLGAVDNGEYLLSIEAGSQDVVFRVSPDGTNYSRVQGTGGGTPQGTKFTIIAVFDPSASPASETMIIYQDNVRKNSVTPALIGLGGQPASVNPGSADLMVGVREDGTPTISTHQDGKFVQMAMWNVPLTSAQVSIANGGGTVPDLKSVLPVGLVSHVKAKDVSFATVIDDVSDNDITLVNMARTNLNPDLTATMTNMDEIDIDADGPTAQSCPSSLFGNFISRMNFLTTVISP